MFLASLLFGSSKQQTQGHHSDQLLLNACFSGNHSTIVCALDNGANIHITCSDAEFKGYTPLLICAFNGNQDATTTLIEHGANIYALTGAMQNVLHLTAASGNKDIIEQLVTLKPTEVFDLLNQKDNNGNTPLHLSIFNIKFIATTEYLLTLGANPHLTNGLNKSSLDCARDLNHTETIMLLESHLIKCLISKTLESIRNLILDKAEKGFNFSDAWILNKAIGIDSKIIVNNTATLSPKTESEVFYILENTQLLDIKKYLLIKEKYMQQYQPSLFRSNDTIDFRILIKNLFIADENYCTQYQIHQIEEVSEGKMEFRLL